MEETHLDYNQPFLSVRRFTSTVSSEKNEKTKTNKKLPKTISSLPYYRSELKSGPVSNPGTVPFVWEKSPGRPKYEDVPPAHSIEQPPIAPKLPPGRRMKVKEQTLDKVSESSSPTSCEGRKFASGSLSYSSLEEITAKIEVSKDETEEKESYDSCENDDAYFDALETLSRTESFFLNCSLTGLSDLDDPEIKPSGIFSTDPQTRDFMMGRFLPAAKAMTCDSHQSAYKKPAIVAKKQQQQLKDVISGSKRPLVHRSMANIVPNYSEVYLKEESEDEDDDYHGPENLTSRGCGLLPRFCLLSPVPGLSVRTRAPTRPPVSRRQVRSSSATSNQENKKEGTGSASQEQISFERHQRHEPREHNQSTESSNQKLDGISLYRRLQGSGISTHENKLPQSRFCKEAEVVAIYSFSLGNRCAKNFEELSGHHRTKRDLNFVTPMGEKTLYVDSVQKVTSPEIKSVDSDRKGLEDSMKNDEVISEIKRSEATSFGNFVCKDNEDPNIMEENDKCKDESVKGLELLSAKLKVHSNGYLDTENQQKPIKVENTENSLNLDSLFLIPPPLPKSPSESWLCRTLPSMSSNYLSSRSFIGDKVNFQNKALKVPSANLKWETIVKSTKVQHQHTRNSEELSTPAL